MTSAFGLDIEPEKGSADSGDLEIDLPNLFVAVAEAAEERKSAVALLIDEIQYFSHKELGALIMAMHKVQQRQLPLRAARCRPADPSGAGRRIEVVCRAAFQLSRCRCTFGGGRREGPARSGASRRRRVQAECVEGSLSADERLSLFPSGMGLPGLESRRDQPDHAGYRQECHRDSHPSTGPEFLSCPL